MPEKKHLKLEVLTTKWGKLLRVVEQTHREDAFGKERHDFVGENGFKLSSLSCPAAGQDVGALYVRGEDWGKDEAIIPIPNDDWLDKCRAAVRDYNQYFSGDDKRQVELDADVEVIE
jgi:hypothetical protein